MGNHLVLFPRFDAEATLRAVDEHRGTFMFVVPTMMLRMWRLGEEARDRYDLSSLEVLWHFAAPCPEWLKADWIDWLGGERICELYGGTELQAMTVIRGDEWLEHRGSVGRCMLGEMKVVDPDTGDDLPPGEVGEIYMRRDAEGTPAYRYVGLGGPDPARPLGEPGRHGRDRRRRLRVPQRSARRHDPRRRRERVSRRGRERAHGTSSTCSARP